MPGRGMSGSDAFIAGLMMPTTNWGQQMAAKDQQLRYQSVLTQQAEQELLQEQQAAAQIENFQAKLRTLPLERPDQERVHQWLRGREKETTERLKTYGGSLAKFIAAEGSQWMQQTLGALEESPEYKTGIANKEQVELYKQATKKGENIVGQVLNKQYVPATRELTDYYSGKTPSYTFRGSYKDDNDINKHFESQYGPSKYMRTAVPDVEIQNYLLANKSPEIAADIYHRRFAGGRSALFYKVDPLEDKLEFQQKQQEFADKRVDRQIDRQLDAARLQGIGLTNALKTKKLNEVKKQDSLENGGLLNNLFKQSVEGSAVPFEKDGRKKLQYSEYDLNRFNINGKATFRALPLYGEENHNLLGQKLNLVKNKGEWTSTTDHPFKEAIVNQNGFNAVDLTGSKYKVINFENKIYTNPNDFNIRGDSKYPEGPMGFARVQVEFDDDEDAASAGLIHNWSFFDRTTKTGTGVYDSSTKRAWLYVPMGGITKDWTFQQQMLKNMGGQKETNDHYDAFNNDNSLF